MPLKYDARFWVLILLIGVRTSTCFFSNKSVKFA